MKRLNADALPFDLHRGEFQTSPGLSTDDDEFDDDDTDDSPASTRQDVIPDLIPNLHISAEDVSGRDCSAGLENRPSSNAPPQNGRPNDLGRSSPLDLQKSRRLLVCY